MNDDDEKAYSGLLEGDFASVKAVMCAIDTRKLQVVTLCTIDGFQLDKWSHNNGFGE